MIEINSSVEVIKLKDEITKEDERWRYFSISFDDFYKLVASIKLNENVPHDVVQVLKLPKIIYFILALHGEFQCQLFCGA